MIKSRIIFVGLLVLAASLVLSACAPAKPKPVTLNVDMKEFVFEPSTMEVTAGAEVTLNLTNSGTLEHEYVIMSLSKMATAPFDADDEGNLLWEAEVEAGEEGQFTFTAPETPGEYELVCGTPGHLEAGMVGTLVVTAP